MVNVTAEYGAQIPYLDFPISTGRSYAEMVWRINADPECYIGVAMTEILHVDQALFILDPMANDIIHKMTLRDPIRYTIFKASTVWVVFVLERSIDPSKSATHYLFDVVCQDVEGKYRIFQNY